MQTTSITSLNQALEDANQWLDELVDRGPFANQDQAYSGLRAVIHAVRDRLTVDEATHLGSQLPMLVRGIYYEGWRPAEAPNTERDVDSFMEHVQSSLGGTATAGMDLPEATRAVTGLLDAHLSDGQVRHVRGQLPEEIESLWGQTG